MAKRTGDNKKGLWITLIVVLALVLVLAVGLFAVVKCYLGQIGRTYEEVVETVPPEQEFFGDGEETPQPSETAQPSEPAQPSESVPSSEPLESSEPEPSPTVEPSGQPGAEPSDTPEENVIDPDEVEWAFIKKIEDDHLINILLVGQDKRAGEKRQRSDTMILCSINPETGEVSLISFLRDLYVQIPGDYSDNRLNAAYRFGGFELLDATLTQNFGVSIDANFEVNFTGFEAIIDMIGGIYMEMTDEEVVYFNNGHKAGFTGNYNLLNGEHALNFARLREIDNDFGRTNRQRKVLLAVFEKINSLSAAELLDLMYNALPYLTTDLTDAQILSIAYRLLPLVTSMEISSYTVPARNAYDSVNIRGMAVLLPDLELIREQLENEYLPLD